ncbi:hypothetical protein [Streptomyces sp. NPDC005438]|uniref:hypothetical protein n=1 Tax=Streptomyces sp. NPDC005438 TaxID=3156880 RepID=UPI0033AE7E6E
MSPTPLPPERPQTAQPPADPGPRRDGDPLIAPGAQPAALTVVLAGLLALGAVVGRPALVVPVVLLQALTSAGWFRLNGMWPARQGIALAFAGGLAVDVGLLAVDGDRRPVVLLGLLGCWFLLVLVLQLRNHSGPEERLYALTALVTATALSVAAGGLLAAEARVVWVGAVAVAAATLVRSLPLPEPVAVVLSVLAATGAGLGVGSLDDWLGGAAALSALVGVAAVVGLRVASYDWPSRFVHFTAGVALPLTLGGVAAQLAGNWLA